MPQISPFTFFNLDFFKNQNQIAYFEVKLDKTFMKNGKYFPEICFVWITINSSESWAVKYTSDQWNTPTWALHLKCWQTTFKFHFSAWTNVNKKMLFAFNFFDLLQETKLFFYFGLRSSGAVTCGQEGRGKCWKE